MSYIITAKVMLGIEVNRAGNTNRVDARILNYDEENEVIIFDIKGDHKRKSELTRELCNTLINAGFCSFEIGHSY